MPLRTEIELQNNDLPYIIMPSCIITSHPVQCSVHGTRRVLMLAPLFSILAFAAVQPAVTLTT
jgi:hypothetical protein